MELRSRSPVTVQEDMKVKWGACHTKSWGIPFADVRGVAQTCGEGGASVASSRAVAHVLCSVF